MKFLWVILAMCVIGVAISAVSGNGIPSGGDDVDPEAAEIIARLLKTRRMSPFGYMGGLPWSSQQQKRNSELINSILGLPKVMNDAGRRK